MQPLAQCSPLCGMGTRRKVKLLGSDKDNSISKAKVPCISKAKEGIHSLLPISRQVFSHLQESRAPPHVKVTWENKHHHSKCPHFLLLAQVYVLSMTSYGMEYPFGQLGKAVPAVSPPSFLCPPACSLVGACEKQKRP